MIDVGMITSMLLYVNAYGDLTTTVQYTFGDILRYRDAETLHWANYRAEMRYQDQSIQLDLTYQAPYDYDYDRRFSTVGRYSTVVQYSTVQFST